MTPIHIFDYIGVFGPSILLFLSAFFLFKRENLLFFYICGFFLNVLLNMFLKITIQEPRPSEDVKLIKMALNNGQRFSFDVYGMPSGHAQLTFYSTVFLLFSLKNKYITLLYLFVTLYTCYQRIKYNNHTILQVIVGSLIGAFMGYAVFLFSKKVITGTLKTKLDDNFLL